MINKTNLKTFITLIILFLTCPFSKAQESLIQEILKGRTNRYCTTGDLKAKGLKMCIKYPSSWYEKEGNRPHILVKLRGNDSPALVVILVKEMDRPLTIQEVNVGVTTNDFLNMAAEMNGTLLSGNRNLLIDGIRAYSCDIYTTQRQLNYNIEFYYRVYSLFYEQYFIQITCGVSKDMHGIIDIPDLKSYFEKHKVLFDLIANSVIIVNQWEQ